MRDISKFRHLWGVSNEELITMYDFAGRGERGLITKIIKSRSGVPPVDSFDYQRAKLLNALKGSTVFPLKSMEDVDKRLTWLIKESLDQNLEKEHAMLADIQYELRRFIRETRIFYFFTHDVHKELMQLARVRKAKKGKGCSTSTQKPT